MQMAGAVMLVTEVTAVMELVGATIVVLEAAMVMVVELRAQPSNHRTGRQTICGTTYQQTLHLVSTHSSSSLARTPLVVALLQPMARALRLTLLTSMRLTTH
jgi:hypothetical protein